jgi:hypothetical protein
MTEKKYICVPFLDPDGIQILSFWGNWNFGKEQGSLEFILDFGAPRARL